MSKQESQFSQTIPFVIQNSNLLVPSIPDVDIKNPLDALNYVNAIEIIPDPAFQIKGMMIVTVDGLTVFTSPNVGFFKNYSRFSIPVTARRLSRQGHVQIFAWNGLADGSPISASGTCIISDQNTDASSGSISSPTPRGSDSISLFPFQFYNIGVYTQQFDLAGYKKMLLLISAQQYQKPTLTGTDTDPAINDGDLSTSKVISVGTHVNVIDYGTAQPRTWGIKYSSGFTTVTVTPEYSLDGVNYFGGSTFNTVTGGNQIKSDTNPPVNARYIRYTIVFPAGASMTLFELYDFLLVGGTSAVSFEAYEIGSQQWIEIISAAQIGTIGQGVSKSVMLGDTMALTNLNAILTSNYSGIRAKLTITNGSVKTSVSFQRLA